MIDLLPDNEAARLNALATYNILDTLPEDEYDAITQLASQICQTPISLISLVDQERQWFKSAVGLSIPQTPREQAFCAHAIQTPTEIMEVEDARQDERFINNPLVTDEPHLIFYAGVPLVDDAGQALGTLCVLDHKPRHLSDQQATSLRVLARQVVTQLQLRKSQLLLEKANEQLNTLNQELYKNNQVLRTVVDNCPAGLVLWQAVREQGEIVDFRYVFTNPVNAKLTGLSIEEMTGSLFKTLFPRSTKNGLFERLVTVVETGRPQQYETYDRFGQVELWANFSLVPFEDGVLITAQDITKLKQVEEQLRQQTENLAQLVAERTAEISRMGALQNAILEHAGLAIISTDVNGIIQTINPATEKLLGYKAAELVGKVTPVVLHDLATLEAIATKFSRQLGRQVAVDFSLFQLMLDTPGSECVLLSKDGRQIPALLTVTPLHDDAGKVIGYIGMSTDITALKMARAELEEKNRELNTFFEVALDLHCIADTNGKIIKTNPAWFTTLGYSMDELASMNHYDLVHPDDREPTKLAIRETIQNRPSESKVNRFRRKDGTYCFIEWKAIVIDHILYASARDITEQQQTERELKNSNQRLHLATQAAGQGIWEYNIDQDKLLWDERLCAIHGIELNKAGMKFQDFLRMIHPDDLEKFYLDTIPKADDSIANVMRVIRSDGEIRYTETRARIIRNKAGAPTRMVGVVWDVTERKQAEFALSQSEERYRSLVNNLSEVVFQSDLNGVWTFLNPSWTRMSGYTVEESIGQPFYTFVAPDDRVNNVKLFKELFAYRKTYSRHVLRYHHKSSGEYRWAEVFAQLVFDDQNQPVGTTGTITDITDRKQAVDALRESEQRFREFAENVDEVFWIHSANPFQLLYVNTAYERMWGMSRQSLYDNPASLLTPVVEEDKPELIDKLKRFVKGEEIVVQYRIRHADGNIRWISSRTFVMRDPEGKPLRYVGIANDITSQKEKEFVLQQSLEREQELNKLKSQFVSTASHEFRTPLATIQSSVDLIKLYLDKPKGSARASIERHLDIIEKEITDFSELLTATLTFGKIDAGRITFVPVWIDLIDLVADAISTHFTGRQDGRTVRLSINGTPRPVYVDSTLITHVLVNLLSNAFKFSDEDTQLDITFDEHELLLVITDKGIGIPAHDLPHLFETFFRASNASNVQGSGLGLVIARQFVDLHGGSLEVLSEENKGTSCLVRLPMEADR
ncbi:PAS domain S-box protein [Spirosoma soli]|uniref:histidine kinase n=1 Tax=Spirosoma soli TaxID=1770529 RepID=A0ABW5M2Z7_9BACT